MATLIQRSGPTGRRVWQARVRRKGYPSIARTFDRKTDAEAWARQVEAEMQRGVFISRIEAENTTLAEVLRRYASEVTPSKKGAAKEESRISVFLRDPIASRTLAALDGATVAEFRDRRLKINAPKSVRNDLTLLRHVLQVADREWRLFLPRGNPVDAVRKPPAPRGRERRLLPGEETRLLAACRAYADSRAGTSPIESLVILALETAMRRGELASMRWEHLERQGTVLRVPETKTGEPRRVPLSTRARAVLDALPRRIDGYVWGIRADSITQAFDRAVKRARKNYEAECQAKGEKPDGRMLRDLRFHDLRHEATSRLFEKGLNPMQAAAVTGHKTLQMLKRYTHLRAEDLVELLG
ncbi:MAG: hypothetical protein B7Z66_07330 [Chromatiales bacterium 21-64-14]|nr:MAG: hypothetical protein B7Z66_07330 [Chromatiales bacterium 21-64-14]HQU15454.1 site-specific integrase [Gammaproteobacteria bacterium]